VQIQGRSTGRLVCHSLLPLSNTADSMESCTNSKSQVCFEFLFDSVRPTAVLPCGHTIHSQCLRDLQKARTSTCPICMKSYGDMARVRRCYSLVHLSVSFISNMLKNLSQKALGMCWDMALYSTNPSALSPTATWRGSAEFRSVSFKSPIGPYFEQKPAMFICVCGFLPPSRTHHCSER